MVLLVLLLEKHSVTVSVRALAPCSTASSESRKSLKATLKPLRRLVRCPSVLAS